MKTLVCILVTDNINEGSAELTLTRTEPQWTDMQPESKGGKWKSFISTLIIHTCSLLRYMGYHSKNTKAVHKYLLSSVWHIVHISFLFCSLCLSYRYIEDQSICLKCVVHIGFHISAEHIV